MIIINCIKEMKHTLEKICYKDYLNKNLKVLENWLIQNSYAGLVIQKIQLCVTSRNLVSIVFYVVEVWLPYGSQKRC